MKTLIICQLFISLLVLTSPLFGQEPTKSMMNEIGQSEYSVCYAKINEIDSIPFLKVVGIENNIISEELVFGLDLDFCSSIQEIEEAVFVEFTYSIDPVHIANAEYNNLTMLPLLSLSKQLGIEFYGIIIGE